MADTIDRTYEGDLSAGDGSTFRTNLNADRTILYEHTEELEAQVEAMAASYLGKGTMPDNAAVCYIDTPTAGKVYCEVGYRAIIGGVPVVTEAILEQSYSSGSLNYVFLVVESDNDFSLRVTTASASENDNDLLIATVTAVPAIDNSPTGKTFARIPSSRLADYALLQGTPEFTVGTEASDTINVAVQLKDATGTALTYKCLCRAWLSDTAGGALSTVNANQALIGTNGTIVSEPVSGLHWLVASNASGQFDLDIEYSGALTWYLNVEYQGKVYSSEAITFV